MEFHKKGESKDTKVLSGKLIDSNKMRDGEHVGVAAACGKLASDIVGKSKPLTVRDIHDWRKSFGTPDTWY